MEKGYLSVLFPEYEEYLQGTSFIAKVYVIIEISGKCIMVVSELFVHGCELINFPCESFVIKIR